MNVRTVLLLSMAVWSAGAFAQSQPQPQPLDLLDVLNLHRFVHHSTIELSADGRQVAYAVLRSSDEAIADSVRYTATGAPQLYGRADVWVADTQSGKARNLTEGKGVSWGAAWSPDGRSLAFCSDRDGKAGLWIWDRQTSALRRVGEFIPRAHALEWSPDGKRILIGVLPEGAPLMVGASSGNDELSRREHGSGLTGLTVQVFESTGGAAGGTGTQNIGSKHYASDLSLVDVASGRVDRVARGVSLAKTAFSPDGRHIAFSEITGDNVAGTHIQLYTLKLFSLDTRQVKTLVPPEEIGRWGHDFSWSPDSRALAYRLGHDSGEVRLVSPTGESHAVTSMAHPPFRGIPAWDTDGKRLLLICEEAVWSVSAADGDAREIARLPGRKVQMLVPVTSRGDRLWLREGGRSVLAVVSDGIDKELHRVSLDGGATRLLFRERKEYTGLSRYNVLASPSAGRIVYAAEDAGHPEDLWITDPDLKRSTQLTQLNPNISKVRMGSLQLVEWTGGDGLPYTGALLLPSSYEPGKRYPLVTYVYPVDVVPDANRFGSTHMSNEHFNLQLMATRGYAVLYSGATWKPADREPMKSVANAVLPGIDRVIEMGIADPGRLGVCGASAGGYSTLALIVQSTRFKVAMAQAGVGNLLSLYGGLDDQGYSHGLAINENSFQFPDPPWKDREQYIRNSPWFFLDKVETPLLLIHGADDSAAIVTLSNEVFVGLRRLGKTVQYARYAGEGHGLISLQNRIDAGRRFLDWFERYLKPETPMPML